MKWTMEGKVLTEKEVYKKLDDLRQDGPTGILLVGADGAVKSAVISKLWNNVKDIVSLHIYGGAGPDMSNGKLVLENPPDLSSVNHDCRYRCIKKFRDDGAKNMVIIWVKYPSEIGWTHNLGYTIDRVLRDNPPKEDIELLLEVEELGKKH